jgi:hypothetical protein
MSRLITLSFGLLLSFSAMAQSLALKGFEERFALVRNSENRVTQIKLKKAITRFSIKPFLEQIKLDLQREQASFMALNPTAKEAEIEQMLVDMGVDVLDKSNGSREAQAIKEALLNVPNIDIEQAFLELGNKGDFWAEFQRRLKEAMDFIDPTILTYHDDARFFYKRNVTYKVVVWALEQAKKQFSNIPVLNIASFVIVRVHDMMLEQRHFHHNMLLHYFETIPETKLGMTKEEVDFAVSSIFEYRIDAMNVFESNRAARDWSNYGMNNFYMMVRSGNGRIRDWSGPLSSTNFQDIKKLNFGFASVTQEGARKIYHLHLKAHMFSSKPSLAYDYSNPNRVKRNRALLNIAGVALGFINIPGWLKSNVDSFIKSVYVEQVRMEGALVGYFESTGDTKMIDKIYSQRANFYILR